MDTQLSEIENWLTGIYQDEKFPEFEHTSDSISLLHRLYVLSNDAEAQARTCIEDFTKKTQEYQSSDELLSSILANVAIDKNKLNDHAMEALNNIVECSLAVDAASSAEADTILAFIRLENKLDKKEEHRVAAHQMQSRLISFSQQLAKKLDHLKTLEQDAASCAEVEQREHLACSRRQVFHEQKIKEYCSEIRAKEAELQHRGFSGLCDHDAVYKKYEELMHCEQECRELQRKLESYSLPADEASARLQVEQLRHELDTLMQEMSCNM